MKFNNDWTKKEDINLKSFHECDWKESCTMCKNFDECEAKKTAEEFIHQNDNCNDTDGKFDLNKVYKFSYKKLSIDDRLQSSMHKTWINKLKKHDGEIVKIIDEDTGNIGTFSIARNWCNEIV